MPRTKIPTRLLSAFCKGKRPVARPNCTTRHYFLHDIRKIIPSERLIQYFGICCIQRIDMGTTYRSKYFLNSKMKVLSQLFLKVLCYLIYVKSAFLIKIKYFLNYF